MIVFAAEEGVNDRRWQALEMSALTAVPP